MSTWRRLVGGGRTARVPTRRSGQARGCGCRLRLERLEDRTLLAAGALDPTFGEGGRVITDFRGPVESIGRAAAVQQDGKIVMAGGAAGGLFVGGSAGNFTVVRYQADGTLDPGFGSGGQVLTVFRPGPLVSEEARALAVQADGKIVAAGLRTQGLGCQFLVSRYLVSGQLDTGFGSGGKLIIDAPDLSGFADMEVQPDGRILVAGTTGTRSPIGLPVVNPAFVLFRFTGDGIPDPTFGNGGRVGGPAGSAGDMALQPDGRIVVLGADSAGFVVARYRTDGSPDASFGEGGRVLTGLGGNPSIPRFPIFIRAVSVVVQPDGKILTAGNRTQPPGCFGTPLLARYNPDGTLDSGFGTGGVTGGGCTIRPEGAVDLALQPDGTILVAGAGLQRFTAAGALDMSFGTRGQVDLLHSAAALVRLGDGGILVVGWASRDMVSGQNLAVSRYTAEGAPDTTFGTGGRAVSRLTGPISAVVGTILVQPDGKVVLAGTARSGPPEEPSVVFALVRYNPNGSLDTGFGTGGRVTTAMGVSVDERMVGAVLQPDGKIVIVGATFRVTPTIALARYNPDGSLDSGFGDGGRVLDTGGPASPSQLVLQPDGGLLVAGHSDLTAGLARFTSDGRRDTNFVAEIPNPVSHGAVAGLLVLPDGKILLSKTGVAALVRLLPTGRLDRTFGNQGVAPAEFGGRLALLPNGQFLVAGGLGAAFPELGRGVARYHADGTLDPAFGSHNSHRPPSDVYPGFSMTVSALAVQPGGKVLLAGYTAEQTGDRIHRIVLTRLDPNGTLDPLFGEGGKVVFDLVNNFPYPASLALQPDGRMLVAATPDVNSVNHFGTVRALPDDPIANPTERFVTQLYADLLRRRPDAAGLTAFVAGLDGGRFSRTQLVQVFTASAEYHGVVVRELYRTFLRRDADPGGLTAFAGFLGAGGTVAQVTAILVGSAEYFDRLAPMSPHDFLTWLYRDVLSREIDPGGRALFGQALAAGVPRAVVAAIVLGSQEALQRQVGGWYPRFLRRAADPAGLQAFVAALQAGFREEVVLGVLAGSDEYFGRL